MRRHRACPCFSSAGPLPTPKPALRQRGNGSLIVRLLALVTTSMQCYNHSDLLAHDLLAASTLEGETGTLPEKRFPMLTHRMLRIVTANASTDVWHGASLLGNNGFYLNSSTSLYADRVHPNALGHALVAEGVTRMLADAIAPTVVRSDPARSCAAQHARLRERHETTVLEWCSMVNSYGHPSCRIRMTYAYEPSVWHT